MRRAVVALAVFLVILLALACTRESADLSQNPPPQSTTANPQSGTGQDTALNPTVPINRDSPTSRVPAAAESSQQVELLEYGIGMPRTLAAGKQSLTVVNAGKEKHALAIEGLDVRTPEVTAGSSATLEVDLKPGTYTVYCPVEGHRGKGMSATVVVQ
jgi:plastocyanin